LQSSELRFCAVFPADDFSALSTPALRCSWHP
jgi:hypothetical protein